MLDGFHNWDAVHAGAQNDERQLQHTFVIARAQRRRALKAIPGLANLVDGGKGEGTIEDASYLLLDQARIMEGEQPSDPQAFTRRFSEVMVKALG